MRSRMLYQFFCWDNLKAVNRMFENCNDIDILYDDGVIIRSFIAKNQASLLKAALDYFENKQFPEKGSQYKEASHKLIEILEDASDGIDSSLDVSFVISKYIGNDIAILSDVDDMDGSVDLEDGQSVHKYEINVNSALSKSSGIGDCILAAKEGNNAVIRKNLDMTDRSHKLMVISTAIQNGQEIIIDTIVEMAQNNKQKATILRTAGDIYTKCSLFQKAEEYYNKSFEMHPKYYITYSKIGALYQRWSSEESSALDQEELKQKAVENYSMAIKSKPKHIKYIEVQERLKILNEQLESLQDMHSLLNPADTKSYEATEELLSYLSEDDDEVDIVGKADSTNQDF